jgi:hypothetical protein
MSVGRVKEFDWIDGDGAVRSFVIFTGLNGLSRRMVIL